MQRYSCPMHPEVILDLPAGRQANPGACPKCGMDLVKKEEHTKHADQKTVLHQADHQGHSGILYTCPMDPDVIQDAPGNCPKCGMKLVPMTSVKEEGHEKHHASMENDFRERFFITLPFVLFSMLLSPNIQKWLGVELAFAGRDLVLFVIGTFIFF